MSETPRSIEHHKYGTFGRKMHQFCDSYVNAATEDEREDEMLHEGN